MSKRHQKASTSLAHMTQAFTVAKEPTFLSLLNKIQNRLTTLHDGSDEEYSQQIAVLEDERDRELLEVEAARGFALERIDREYEEEKRLAEREFQVSTQRKMLIIVGEEEGEGRVIDDISGTDDAFTIR